MKIIINRIYYSIFIISGFAFCSNNDLPCSHNTDSSGNKAQAIIENYIKAIGGREKLEQIHSIWASAQIRILFFKASNFDYRTYLSDTAHLYLGIGGVHFLGKKLFATFNKDTTEHTYVFFRRKKKGITYLMPYKHWKRPQKKEALDVRRASYQLYGQLGTFGGDSSLLSLFIPSETDSFVYHGSKKKKKNTYEIICYRNKKKPNVYTLYYFDKNTHLLAIEQAVKTDTTAKGKPRVRTEPKTYYSEYQSIGGILYPRKIKQTILFSVKRKDVKINLSEKEALRQYPYFHLLDSAVRLRAELASN